MESMELNFYDYKIFEEAGVKYVYSTNNTGIFEIDDRTYKFLLQEGKTLGEAKKAVEDYFTEEELEELIQDMTESQFIRTSQNDMKVLEESNLVAGENILSITLLLAQECNLRCTYCYGEDGEYADKGLISIQTACKAVDFLIENSGMNRELSVVFFGGEPLIAFKIMKDLVPYIREREKETGKNIRIRMTTNGTLISGEVEKFLLENNIQAQISIDGDEDTQNANRFFANKKGTYETVVNNTASMRKSGVLTARATLTNKQMNLRHTFEHLNSLEFSSIAISPAHNLLSEEDYEIYAEEEILFIKEFENLIKQKRYHEAKKMIMVVNQLKKVHNGGIRILPCGVGRNMYAIDIHGDIYPCQRFVNNKEYKLGNIYGGNIKREEFQKEIQLSNHIECGDCWARNLCVGGCPHENLSATGKTTVADSKACSVNKRKYREVIGVYLRLTEEEKEIMLYNKKY